MPKGTDPPIACSIEGCEKAVLARGWCASHYHRWKRHGDPLGGGRTRVIHSGTSAQRFWAKVDKKGPVPAHRPELGPCWVWKAALSPYGYAIYKWPGKPSGGAHRVAYELLVGPIPDGLTLDHLCHNGSGCEAGDDCPHRACVNPDHLEPVTIRVNLHRGQTNARKTHCPRGHEYTKDNTRIRTRRNGTQYRECRTCHRDRRREEERARHLAA